MKKYTILLLSLLTITLFYSSCKLDRLPETSFSDIDFWNTETDLINATNRLYQQLDGYYPLDNRGDDNVHQSGPNGVSSGNRTIPNTNNDDWSEPYRNIFIANNILQKGVKAQVSEAVKNRYFGEARFFRAYNYFRLVQKFGDVPLLLNTLEINSPELLMGRTDRAEVVQSIYEDLDFAAAWLPTIVTLPAAQYGRVTKSSALALKARIGLFEGTRAKFHNEGDGKTHLDVAVKASEAVMGQGHKLFSSYAGMFVQEGEGRTNTENIFVKIYGVDNTNLLVSHNYSRDLENGRVAPTRNLLRQYLYTDGLPAFDTENKPTATKSVFFVNEGDESSYNTIFENRDPRLAATVFRAGEEAYKGPWIPITSLGSRSGYAGKKGFNVPDWTINSGGTVDKSIIRYAEVLLIYAEAKYELNNLISDADLDLTINKLRERAGLNVKLSNAFVTANHLDMRQEIRRERAVELALEGFHYDDLIRWKTAEIVLPQALLGAKYIPSDWPGTGRDNLNLNSDDVIVVEPSSTRNFLPNRDYLYPVPFNEITLSDGNVKQNPNWN